MSHSIKTTILLTVIDLVSNFIYYDRKDDEDLPRGVIEEAIKSGAITQAEICEVFQKALEDALDN
jgi:hypothetical protein